MSKPIDLDAMLRRVHRRLGGNNTGQVVVAISTYAGEIIQFGWRRTYADGAWSDWRFQDHPTLAQGLQAILDHEDEQDRLEAEEEET